MLLTCRAVSPKFGTVLAQEQFRLGQALVIGACGISLQLLRASIGGTKSNYFPAFYFDLNSTFQLRALSVKRKVDFLFYYYYFFAYQKLNALGAERLDSN